MVLPTNTDSLVSLCQKLVLAIDQKQVCWCLLGDYLLELLGQQLGFTRIQTGVFQTISWCLLGWPLGLTCTIGLLGFQIVFTWLAVGVCQAVGCFLGLFGPQIRYKYNKAIVMKTPTSPLYYFCLYTPALDERADFQNCLPF